MLEVLQSFNKIQDIVNYAQFSKMYADINNLDKYIKEIEEKNIRIITKFDENYPSCLNNVDNPPHILYCKGDISLLKGNNIAIVGTRKPTNYGYKRRKYQSADA